MEIASILYIVYRGEYKVYFIMMANKEARKWAKKELTTSNTAISIKCRG